LLRQIAAEANAKRPEGEDIHLSAHVLRHTILRCAANQKRMHYATELEAKHYELAVRVQAGGRLQLPPLLPG
jgi:hypothetical protein